MITMMERAPVMGRAGAVMSNLRTDTAVELFMKRVFTVDEVAEQLGLSKKQVQNHMRDGSIATVNLGRGTTRRDPRVMDVEIDRFLESRKVRVGVADAVDDDSYEARYAARASRRGR